MKRLLFLCFLFPFLAGAHPGIGIVADSKGNIYYSDLQQVFKIANGVKTVAVANVHTHELFIDANDNLYGQHEITISDHAFAHWLWRLRPDGRLDTVVGKRPSYEQVDFSLARDRQGNEYYTRQFIKRPESAHIYKKSPDGRETVFASGNFKGVRWLHPQDDGSVLLEMKNNVYRVDASGKISLLASNIAAPDPDFAYFKSPTVWGLWQDKERNVYVAAFSDQLIKKIAADGTVTDHYRSTGKWAPIQGVADNKGRMWVLESSDKHEFRVVQLPLVLQTTSTSDDNLAIGFLAIFLAIGGFVLYRYLKRKR